MAYHQLGIPDLVHTKLMLLKKSIDDQAIWKTTMGNLLAHLLEVRDLMHKKLMATIDRSASAQEVVFDIYELQELFTRSPKGEGSADLRHSARASRDRKLAAAIDLERRLGIVPTKEMVNAYLDARHNQMRDGGTPSAIEEFSEQGLDQNGAPASIPEP